MTETLTPYATMAPILWSKGWRGVLPLPAGRKLPPPAGFTGHDGADPSWPDIQAWLDNGKACGNVALRLPDGVVAIDVDDYDGKHGLRTMRCCEAEWGGLPPTWRVGSRGGSSGIGLFTTPTGLRWPRELPGAHVDVITNYHRFVVAPPSVHPDGRLYRLLSPDLEPLRLEDFPRPEDLPAMPDAWVKGLSQPAGEGQRARHTGPKAEPWPEGQQPDDRQKTYLLAAVDCESAALAAVASGQRNDVANKAAFALGQLVTGAGLGREFVIDRLTQACETNGLLGDDGAEAVARTLRSGLDSGGGSPRAVPDATGAPILNGHAGTHSQPAQPGRTLRLTKASGIKPRLVRWLFEKRLAVGSLSLLAGPEGLGKSTLAYDLAGRVTLGTLPGEYLGKPRSVLVCATEDAWAETIVPRLMAAGADLDRIYRVEVVTRDDIQVGLELPADLDQIRRAAAKVDAVLLLLDPLLSRLSESLDTHKDADVRRALEPLVAMLAEARLAGLGLIHLNKGGANAVLDRVMASKAFTAVARSVSVVLADPSDDTGRRRLFGTPKNNLGRSDLPTLTFTVESQTVPTEEGDAEVGVIRWGDDSPATIQEAMDEASTPGMSGLMTEAMEWLSDYMEKEGRTRSADVKAAAAKVGIKDATLHRARGKLGIRHVSEGFPRETWWYQDGFHPATGGSNG